jgi:hypothetical protein
MAKWIQNGLSSLAFVAIASAAALASADVSSSIPGAGRLLAGNLSTLNQPEPPVILPPIDERQEDETRSPEKGRASSLMAFNEVYTFDAKDGCDYTARLKGTLRPVVSGPDAGQRVEPELDISATLQCPRSDPQSVSTRIAGTGPITRGDLEDLLEGRATIVSKASGRRCTYVPDISLVGDSLVGKGLTQLCPIAQNESTGTN